MFWEGGWECARLIGSYDTLGQTPHFYWPDSSFLLARPLTSISQTRPRHGGPCRTVSGHVGTVPDRAVPVGRVAVSA